MRVGSNIDGEESAGDDSGHFVSLSRDGSVLTVASPATFEYLEHFGATLVDENSWEKIGTDVNSDWIFYAVSER